MRDYIIADKQKKWACAGEWDDISARWSQECVTRWIPATSVHKDPSLNTERLWKEGETPGLFMWCILITPAWLCVCAWKRGGELRRLWKQVPFTVIKSVNLPAPHTTTNHPHPHQHHHPPRPLLVYQSHSFPWRTSGVGGNTWLDDSLMHTPDVWAELIYV